MCPSCRPHLLVRRFDDAGEYRRALQYFKDLAHRGSARMLSTTHPVRDLLDPTLELPDAPVRSVFRCMMCGQEWSVDTPSPRRGGVLQISEDRASPPA